MVVEIIESPTFDYALYTPIYQIEGGIQQSFKAKMSAKNNADQVPSTSSLQEHSVQNEMPTS